MVSSSSRFFNVRSLIPPTPSTTLKLHASKLDMAIQFNFPSNQLFGDTRAQINQIWGHQYLTAWLHWVQHGNLAESCCFCWTCFAFFVPWDPSFRHSTPPDMSRSTARPWVCCGCLCLKVSESMIFYDWSISLKACRFSPYEVWIGGVRNKVETSATRLHVFICNCHVVWILRWGFVEVLLFFGLC